LRWLPPNQQCLLLPFFCIQPWFSKFFADQRKKGCRQILRVIKRDQKSEQLLRKVIGTPIERNKSVFSPIEPHKHEQRLRFLDAPRCIGTAWPNGLRVFPNKVDVFSGTL
jgi:hypothetical protein